MPIPLGPGRVFVLRDVQRIDDGTALPATVRGGVRPVRRIPAVGYLADPGWRDSDAVDVDSGLPRSAYTAPGDSSSETSAATRSPSPFEMASNGVAPSRISSLVASQVGM